MAGKGKQSKGKKTAAAAAVATTPIVDDTSSETSSVDANAEPNAEAPVADEATEAVEDETVEATPVVEEATVETAPADVAAPADVIEPVAVTPTPVEVEAVEVVAPEAPVVEAVPEPTVSLTHEETVLTDTTPRSPRHDILALPVDEATTMWFLHPSYYYQKTKEVYTYTTSFRGVGAVAHVGETSVNYLLKHLNMKQVATLQDVDTSLAPALATIDEQLDERVAGVLKTLVDGQEYILAKKEQVVGRAKEVQSATLEKVSAVTTTATDKVSKTVESVTTTVEKTRASVTQVTSNALESVSKAKDATIETLTATAHSFLSYVPLLNKKVMA
ncbi:hypothetical protein SPRG_01850 [Saprolegnia parasitica CBS 223.65]|uniref:Uncharacterized protein n=1 Tax=Saprolegnia parasitica (strain CBS 223.65) TaxID=695850 RepID=A0A067CQQ5_SAPPC|nr:hypothetical protein SPRG_01850 [Saprolegnia parasitica CBS 223.65]KDO33034.1 hypothetical protein SPRG_01850 [Saprolegnia parasitica CBS 223.65]|eukprot:XP_012195806.1 hypothetical protein SPRG_01850 [Saprolegnia parasitica CBS 223.65]